MNKHQMKIIMQLSMRIFWLITLPHLVCLVGHAESFVRNIPGTSNIFGASGVLIGDGTLPVCINSNKLKPKKAIIFNSVTGGVNCGGNASNPATPDGTGGCNFASTSVNPSSGNIAGVNLPGNLFLLGVFTKRDSDSGNRPDTADDDYSEESVLTPEINKPFFIGDGLTGNGTGEKQRFRIPNNAGRFCLGFADALGFGGQPGYYFDNVGSIAVDFKIIDDDKFTIGGIVRANLETFVTDEPITVQCKNGFEKTVRTDRSGRYSLKVPKGRCTIRPKTTMRFPSTFTPVSSSDPGNRPFTPQAYSEIIEEDNEDGFGFTTILYQGTATTIRNPAGTGRNCKLSGPKGGDFVQIENLPRGFLVLMTPADRLSPDIFKVKPMGPYKDARLYRNECIGVRDRDANIGAPISFIGIENIVDEKATLPVHLEYGG